MNYTIYTGGSGSPENRRGIAISWMEFEYPYHIPEFRGQFQNPSRDLKTGADLQEFRALIRRSNVEIGIVQTSGATGVTTADRRYLDIGSIEWNAELSNAKIILIS